MVLPHTYLFTEMGKIQQSHIVYTCIYCKYIYVCTYVQVAVSECVGTVYRGCQLFPIPMLICTMYVTKCQSVRGSITHRTVYVTLCT